MGEKLEGVEGVETVIGMLCVRKKLSSVKKEVVSPQKGSNYN